MGREIRRVPKNWKHPEIETPDYRAGTMTKRFQGMHDRPYREAITEWFSGWQKWERKEFDGFFADEDGRMLDYWQYNGNPPQHEYYRPDWRQEEMVWWQVYETVSEGTPVTPAFATREELVDYLVAHGDFWDQKRRKEGCKDMRCTPWPRAEAEALLQTGSAMSLVVKDGKVMSGTEYLAQCQATQ